MVLGIFLTLKWAVYPLIDPLQISKPFYVCFHAGGAVLLHALRNMAVHIKGKSGGSVAQVALDGFHVVPILEGEDSKGVS